VKSILETMANPAHVEEILQAGAERREAQCTGIMISNLRPDAVGLVQFKKLQKESFVRTTVFAMFYGLVFLAIGVAWFTCTECFSREKILAGSKSFGKEFFPSPSLKTTLQTQRGTASSAAAAGLKRGGFLGGFRLEAC